MTGKTPSTTDDASSSNVETLGAVIAAGAFAVVVGGLVLMGIGLVVRDLSTVVGTPLPYVHDDPDRIEWGGLAELVAYGLAGALVLYALYLLGQRVLPAAARAHIGRVIGVAGLLVLAVSGAVVAIDDRDPAAALFALGCGYSATRVARGLPLDDDEDEPQADGSTDAKGSAP